MNYTLTTANTAQSSFIQACNAAYMQVTSGAFSVNSAVKTAVASVGRSGTWVLYPTGHRDRLDVAVRRAVRTGVAQTCGQLQIQQLDDMMWDVVDTTAHADARESHTVWQGGRFSYKGRNPNYPDFEEATGYGSADGLMGINCRHGFFPAVDGSPRMYPKAQLAEWKNRTVTYNGTEYAGHEAVSMQRAYERGIRATKRELTALDEGAKASKDEALQRELSEAFSQTSLKLKRQEAAINDFLEQTGLKPDYERPQVREFDRRISGKAKAAARKELTAEREKGIIKERDIQIGKSLGAAAFRDIVSLPNGNKGKIQEGSKITKVVVFAGKGTSKELRVAKHLEKQYNVPQSEWKHSRGNGYVVCDDGKTRYAELHWFESDNTGRIKMKVKRYFDDES